MPRLKIGLFRHYGIDAGMVESVVAHGASLAGDRAAQVYIVRTRFGKLLDELFVRIDVYPPPPVVFMQKIGIGTFSRVMRPDVHIKAGFGEPPPDLHSTPDYDILSELSEIHASMRFTRGFLDKILAKHCGAPCPC